ncbi:hypothetical protein [Streptomyces sp. NPDC056883]|uniref:hypothetical protein n=1 Tax=Streptomyces sp. NPDC056883 TaxID=3345959 RepID=UPI0036BCB42A
MSETDPHRTSTALELLTLLTGGATAPATARLRPPADRDQQLGNPSDQQLRSPSDLRERLTDGIVELRKRRQIAVHRAAEAPWYLGGHIPPSGAAVTPHDPYETAAGRPRQAPQARP